MDESLTRPVGQLVGLPAHGRRSFVTRRRDDERRHTALQLSPFELRGPAFCLVASPDDGLDLRRILPPSAAAACGFIASAWQSVRRSEAAEEVVCGHKER